MIYNKIIIVFFIAFNLHCRINAQDTTYIINGVKVNFYRNKAKELKEITRYEPLVNDSVKKNVIKYLNKFLNKYPLALKKHALKEIYICEKLKHNDIEVGGLSYQNDKILIMAFNSEEINTNDYWYWMERLFHHEFSHIIFKQYKHLFTKKKWVGNNLVSYYPNKVQNKFINTDVFLDTTQLKLGFPSQYARHNMDEDFAVFSEFLLTPEQNFELQCNNYKASLSKYKMVTDFYQKIDSTFFNKKFFKEITLSSVKN